MYCGRKSNIVKASLDKKLPHSAKFPPFLQVEAARHLKHNTQNFTSVPPSGCQTNWLLLSIISFLTTKPCSDSSSTRPLTRPWTNPLLTLQPRRLVPTHQPPANTGTLAPESEGWETGCEVQGVKAPRAGCVAWILDHRYLT